MSQSVNRGKKSAASKVAADTVEPVESVRPTGPVEEAEETAKASAVVEQPTQKASVVEYAGEAADQGVGETASLADESVETAGSEPAAAEAAAAEAVVTPASMSVVDEATTPAEALSPYESTGADATVEAQQVTAWPSGSGDMPPSIAPKSPAFGSGASRRRRLIPAACAAGAAALLLA